MRILVCIKQVPETTSIALDECDFTAQRDGMLSIINPNDCAAIEQAMLLKETREATVTVMTMGRPQAAHMLREVAARGADKLILLTDTAFAGSDSLATSRILAAAIRYLGGFDLILLGRRAIDGETGHVGPQLSVLLGVECATNVTDLNAVDVRSVKCSRLLEGTRMDLELPLPALLTICGNKSALRPPSISGIKRASSMQVQTLTNHELALPLDCIGLKGSPTRVLRVVSTGFSPRKCKIFDTPQAGIWAILEAISAASASRFSGEDRPIATPKPHLNGKVWAFAWEKDPLSLRTAGELIGAIRGMGVAPFALCVGSQSCADQLVEMGARHVYLFDGEQVFSETGCSQIVAAQARARCPEVILFPATIRGRSIAPQCAAMLSTGLTADCTDLLLNEAGMLTQIRPAFGGSLFAHIECARFRPQLASVRPGVYSLNPVKDPGGFIEHITAEAIHNYFRGESHPIAQNTSLGDAPIVLAGGRGIGTREGFALLNQLASAFGGGAVAASRGAVDSGFAPFSQQVGQTGVTIRPNIYLAFGISGAVHHLAGMKDSGIIVAVNTDPKAQLFSYSDIGIVSPWNVVAQALIDSLGSANRKN